MHVVILKDGTVPVAVAPVRFSDGDQRDYINGELSEEVADSDAHNYVEVFEVPEGTHALRIGWADGMGFDVRGFADMDAARADFLRGMEDGQTWDADTSDPGHWSATVNPGDYEGYEHAIALN